MRIYGASLCNNPDCPATAPRSGACMLAPGNGYRTRRLTGAPFPRESAALARAACAAMATWVPPGVPTALRHASPTRMQRRTGAAGVSRRFAEARKIVVQRSSPRFFAAAALGAHLRRPVHNRFSIPNVRPCGRKNAHQDQMRIYGTCRRCPVTTRSIRPISSLRQP